MGNLGIHAVVYLVALRCRRAAAKACPRFSFRSINITGIGMALGFLVSGCGSPPTSAPVQKMVAQQSEAGFLDRVLGKNSRWGYVNVKGEYVIPPRFEEAHKMRDGMALVRLEGRYGWIDTSGSLLIEPSFDSAFEFEEGIARVEQYGQWGCVDRSGAYVIPAVFDTIEAFDDGLAAFEQNGKWGYIDQAGAIIIGAQYDRVETMHHPSRPLLCVCVDGQWGAIDRTGQTVVVPQLERPFRVYGEDLLLVIWRATDLAPISSEGHSRFVKQLFAFVGRDGRLLPQQFNKADRFYEGLARVCVGGETVRGADGRPDHVGGEWGYIDKTGKLAIPLQYDAAKSFHNGRAEVTLDGKRHMIDKMGIILAELPE